MQLVWRIIKVGTGHLILPECKYAFDSGIR